MDQNSDQSVTKTELESLFDLAGSTSSSIDSFVSSADTDNDAAMSEQEFFSTLAKLLQQMKSDSENNTSAAGAPSPPPKDSSEMFSSLDTDGDGYLTVEELQAGAVPDAEKIFGEIDADSDGKVSQTESDTFDEKMKVYSPQVDQADSGSVTLTSLQMNFLNKLVEMIAQNNNYVDASTGINSVVA